MLDVRNPFARRFLDNFFSSPVARKMICAAIFCLVLSFVAAAQVPEPAEEDTESLRIGTDLVQTDVMVFDRQGKFVEGLRPEQFELRVDGKVQPISFFEQVKAGMPDEEQKISGSRQRTPSNTPNVAAANSLGGRVIFFFLDDLHLLPDSLNRSRDAILRFVDNDMQLNDRVAIFTVSGQLGVLQQLTSEKAVLRAALKKLLFREYRVRDNERTPMSESQAVSIENNDRTVIDYFVRELAKELNEKIDRRRTVQRNRENRREDRLETIVLARAKSITEQSRFVTRNTLQTLENLIRASTPIRSRKILFLVSDGFFITQNSDVMQQIKQITDSAARSGVVIYSLEAKGLTTGLQDASERGNFDITGAVTALDTRAITSTQEPLRMIARETGGTALLNSNRFGDIFRQWVNETSDYYILAWQPDESQKNVNFRNIEAGVKGRDDLTVRLTRGFFNETPQTDSKNNREKSKKSKEKSPLAAALHALYPRRGLPVFLTAGFTNAAPAGLTLTASVQIDSQALGVEKPEKTDIEIVGVVINDEGKEIAGFNENLTIDPSKMSKSQQRNIFFTKQMPVKPGIYQVRVAVEDKKTQRVGSNFFWIEVPESRAAGFAVGSLFVGEVEANGNQPIINVSRRMLKNSRFFFQTEIYNAAAPVNVGIEMQIFRAGQLVKTLPVRKASTEGVANPANLPYLDDFPLAGLEPGSYVLQINISDRTANKTTSRQIDFFVE